MYTRHDGIKDRIEWAENRTSFSCGMGIEDKKSMLLPPRPLMALCKNLSYDRNWFHYQFHNPKTVSVDQRHDLSEKKSKSVQSRVGIHLTWPKNPSCVRLPVHLFTRIAFIISVVGVTLLTNLLNSSDGFVWGRWEFGVNVTLKGRSDYVTNF